MRNKHTLNKLKKISIISSMKGPTPINKFMNIMNTITIILKNIKVPFKQYTIEL